MDNERIQHQGRLAEAEQDKVRLEIQAKSIRDAIRQQLDPFEKLGDIDGGAVVELSISLAKMLIEYKEKADMIEALKKALRIR